MSRILTWVIGLFGLMPARILAGLGFGFMTFEGYKAAVQALVDSALDSLNSVSGVAYSIISLAGLVDAFGIVLGALIARSAFHFLDKFVKLTTS